MSSQKGPFPAKMRAMPTVLGRAKVFKAPATPLPEKMQTEGRNSAYAIGRTVINGDPAIVLGIIVGDEQVAATLIGEVSDGFAHALAEALEWQNAALLAQKQATLQ